MARDIRARIIALEKRASERAKPGELSMIVAVPAGTEAAEGRPAGVYLTGSHAEVVFDGPEPDPAVLADLQTRLSPHGLTVVSHPT